MSERTAAILKRLAISEFENGRATVTLDGQPVGEVVRERPGFYGAWIGDSAAGGGRNIPNALRSIAVNYAIMQEATR